MKIIKAYVEQMTPPIDGTSFLKAIEKAGRVCYKSEEKISEGPESAVAFVQKLIRNGHEAMIEHAPSISMKFVCDRGVSHEIVRHRLFSFAQESTRYCNYGGKDIVFILPCWFEKHISLLNSGDIDLFKDSFRLGDYCNLEDAKTKGLKVPADIFEWISAMMNSEKSYDTLVERGWSPQEARSVLPNSLKTEIIVTGNLREWRHFFKLRTAKSAHPQMQEVANMALEMLREQIPVVFEDI